ncbi:hypothetical protein CGLO_16439 [Colletotrichum gloeosporioides Cg-14]|uniref:F-box domain-containing protein n=1 Tax=Colletotrichum gloeosporioides (strain Cg-14) TaxID=1237896 RepID=T0JNI6_COLGC|nr:hypothetical protein CGLO_16439 [Colletotrichum gloeosporioides Cg-14]
MEQLDDTAKAKPLGTVDIQSSRLIRLSTEMLLEIAKFFGWHDKFLFSHICRRAKQVIGMVDDALNYRLCDHMDMADFTEKTWPPKDDWSPESYRWDVRKAFVTRGSEVKGYCKYCLIDYTLVASVDSFVVQSWQSLGRYDRPQDALPDRPLLCYELLKKDRWPQLIWHNVSPRSGIALMGGELVYHQPGSVRDAYMSG